MRGKFIFNSDEGLMRACMCPRIMLLRSSQNGFSLQDNFILCIVHVQPSCNKTSVVLKSVLLIPFSLLYTDGLNPKVQKQSRFFPFYSTEQGSLRLQRFTHQTIGVLDWLFEGFFFFWSIHSDAFGIKEISKQKMKKKNEEGKEV